MELFIAIERGAEKDPARKVAPDRDAERDKAPEDYKCAELGHVDGIDDQAGSRAYYPENPGELPWLQVNGGNGFLV